MEVRLLPEALERRCFSLSSAFEEVSLELTLALDRNDPAEGQAETALIQNAISLIRHLVNQFNRVVKKIMILTEITL